MGKNLIRILVAVVLVFVPGACDKHRSVDKTGEIQLSSQTFSENYYIFGYSYEDGEFYRFPYQGDPFPDIINEGFRVLEGGKVVSLPGFNTPGGMNGFALVGAFTSFDSGRSYYEAYAEVEAGLQFETVSDTVELYQVWVQQTADGNYAKLFIKEIQTFESESGNMYNEVTLEFTYQPDGSTTFPG